MGKKMNVWDAIIHNGQHHVFRLVSLVFSVVSAWAIYWFFSALGSSLFQQVVTIGTSAGFVALGYFVTRCLGRLPLLLARDTGRHKQDRTRWRPGGKGASSNRLRRLRSLAPPMG